MSPTVVAADKFRLYVQTSDEWVEVEGLKSITPVVSDTPPASVAADVSYTVTVKATHRLQALVRGTRDPWKSDPHSRARQARKAARKAQKKARRASR